MVTEVVETQEQYVCFVKSRMGAEFIPYTQKDGSGTLVVNTIRAFLDREIDVWLEASSKGSIDTAVLVKISREQFVKDVVESGLNSKLRSMLGWNYADAARIVEEDGYVFLVTTHPRFESRPCSFCDVRDNDLDAMLLVEELLSVLGGEIAFEKYDPVKHVAGYRYGV